MGGFLSRHDKRIRDWMDSDDEAPSAYSPTKRQKRGSSHGPLALAWGVAEWVGRKRTQEDRCIGCVLSDGATVSESDEGPYVTVAYPGQRRRYHVLLGAELHVPDAANAKCSKVDFSGRRVADDDDSAADNLFCVSHFTRLGPPFVAAVACTCPDWRARGGLNVALKADERSSDASKTDASVGCKHMMLCNTQILEGAPITLGPAAASSIVLQQLFNGASAGAAAAGPKAASAGVYSVLGHLPGELAERRGASVGVRVDQENDDAYFEL